MAWIINYTETAIKNLKKLDKPVSTRIITFLEDKVINLDDPRSVGEALKGNLGGLWRYRVGDYRVIVDIQNDVLNVLVLRVAHRKEVYE